MTFNKKENAAGRLKQQKEINVALFSFFPSPANQLTRFI